MRSRPPNSRTLGLRFWLCMHRNFIEFAQVFGADSKGRKFVIFFFLLKRAPGEVSRIPDRPDVLPMQVCTKGRIDGGLD